LDTVRFDAVKLLFTAIVLTETESSVSAFVQFCCPLAPVVKTYPGVMTLPAVSYVVVYWRYRVLNVDIGLSKDTDEKSFVFSTVSLVL